MIMNILKAGLLSLLILLGFAFRGQAAEIFKNDDLTLNLGLRFQELGELDYVSDESVRDKTQVYLFNVEDRLLFSGDFKGYKFHFETALGGEDVNSSNNNISLLEYNVDVPLIPDLVYFKVGQFKVPTNLESAYYEGNMLFTGHSDLMNLFFNQGYDNGLSLWGHMDNLDFAGGVLSGAPDLPQRYLPEIFDFPPMTFLRVGFNDGITDDPFHQLQTGFAKPAKSQFAIHVNGEYEKDSNAGHSTDLNLQSAYLTTFSANGPYGNALLTSLFNPYLSGAGINQVNAQYWNTSLDMQYRAPMGDTTFTLAAQVNMAGYTTVLPAPITLPNGAVVSSGSLNIGGAEIIASVGDNPWELAGRFAVVIPDSNMISAFTPTAGPLPHTPQIQSMGSDPIFEVTFPSITWHMNEDVKLVAETQFLFNTPEVSSTPANSTTGDGTYLITQMPSQFGGGVESRAGIVPIGNMEFQFQL
jgi:hypothetical protein